MKEIIQTRFIHWKKQWITILFWLIFPMLVSIFVMFLSEAIQKEASVPIGIVLEEQTEAAEELLNAMNQSTLIHPQTLTEQEAMHQLEKHELDSVFIVPEGFEEKIEQDDRHRLITSYRSDLSFAYPTVKEIVISHVQQETGRAKAAQVVESLAERYNESGRWTTEEIIAESKVIQAEQDLLHTRFSYDPEQTTGEQPSSPSFLNIWNVWAISALLATFLLFDWPSKEAHSPLRSRFAFIRMTFKQYLLRHLLLYISLFLALDLITIGLFDVIFDEQIILFDYGTMVTYRLMICLGAFLLSLCFKQVYSYYLLSFVLFLLMAISSGAMLPVEQLVNRIQGLEWLNPLYAFVSNQLTILWLIILIIITVIWYVRKESVNATR